LTIGVFFRSSQIVLLPILTTFLLKNSITGNIQE